MFRFFIVIYLLLISVEVFSQDSVATGRKD